MEAIVRRQKKAAGSLEKSIELDNTFHLTLVGMAESEIMLRIVERVNDILSESRAKALQSHTRLNRAINGHIRILEALQQNDRELDSKAMEEHLNTIEEVVLGNKNTELSEKKKP